MLGKPVHRHMAESTITVAGTGHFYLNTFCQQTIFDILFNNGNPGTQFYRAAYANFGADIRNKPASMDVDDVLVVYAMS